MSANIVGHVVRRGLELIAPSRDGMQDDELDRYQMPAWAMIILGATVLFYLALSFSINYTYGEVVPTLTMIETSTTVALVRNADVQSEDPDAPLLTPEEKALEKTSVMEPELYLVKAKPITAKFRTTIQHLRARAGRLSRFRGLQVLLVYELAEQTIIGVGAAAFDQRKLAKHVIAILASIVLCRLQMTWTHVVISEPSEKRWYQRIASRTSGRKVLWTQALFSICREITVIVPAMLYEAFGLRQYVEDPARFGKLDHTNRKAIVLQCLLVGLVGIGTFVLILIPATVTLRRVQASMLPEEDEAIVPFDRTFGGKVVPEVLGGSGKLGILEAWKSFGWASRIRLMKVYVKVIAMQAVLHLLFQVIMLGELQLIMGDVLQKMIAVAKNHVDGQS